MRYIYKIPAKLKQDEIKDGKATGELVEIETHLEGQIVLNLPGFDELEEIALALSSEDGPSGTVDIKSNMQTLKSISHMINKYVAEGGVSVIGNHGDDVIEFSSLNDLSCSVQGRAVVMHLAKIITRGIDLGERQKA
jgi:hypothetical protein